MYWDVANRLAAGLPGGLEPLWPPFYPGLLAWVVRVGADRATVQVLQTLLFAGTVILLFDIGRRVTGRPVVGGIAAGLLALDPQMAAFTQYFWPEVLHLFLVMGIAWILVARSESVGWGAAAGVALGVALLTKNLLGPLVPAILLAWPLTRGRRGLWPATAAACVLAVTVAPTMIDNRRQHGAYFIGDSARFNVWVGLNDRARRNFVDEIVGPEFQRYRLDPRSHREREADLGTRIVTLVQERGIGPVLAAQLGRQYFRLFDKDSFFTNQLPRGAIAALGGGYASVPDWLAAVFRAWGATIYAAVLVAAPFGFVALPASSRRAFGVAAAYLAFTLAVCLISHVKTRYRVQVMPVFYLASAVAVARWMEGHSQAGADGHPSRAAMAIAVTCAVILLVLAFGGAVVP